MNTTLSSYSVSENVESRRSSTETVYTIQGIETDFVRDTSDTEWYSEQEIQEYEPVTEEEEGGPISDESSGQTDEDIISTEVVEVVVADGDVVLADSESTSSSSDSEVDLHDYWLCARCRNRNNNPFYRFCEKCFEVRKNFFPPRPKRKSKTKANVKTHPPSQICSQDSGIEFLCSQPCSQNTQLTQIFEICDNAASSQSRVNDQNGGRKAGDVEKPYKRHADWLDAERKRSKTDHSDSEVEVKDDPSSKDETEVALLAKTTSDPALSVAAQPGGGGGAGGGGGGGGGGGLCITCEAAPRSGVFVHGRIAHICCCYRCATKVWARSKRCPLCNRKVSNVLKVMC